MASLAAGSPSSGCDPSLLGSVSGGGGTDLNPAVLRGGIIAGLRSRNELGFKMSPPTMAAMCEVINSPLQYDSTVKNNASHGPAKSLAGKTAVPGWERPLRNTHFKRR